METVIQKEKGEGVEIIDINNAKLKPTVKDIFNSFTFEELDRREEQTKVITVFGKKHSGKTSITYGFTGNKYYISYDKNSAKPLNTLMSYFFKGIDEKMVDKDFHFINGAKFYNNLSSVTLKEMKDVSEILRKWQEALVKTYYYTIYLLDELAKEEISTGKKIDYLIIDGSEIIWKCCEQIMRVRHQLEASQGFKELNWWKERNILWEVVHQKAKNLAKKAVIYTTYLATIEEEDDDNIIEVKKEPNWYGSMMLETEIKLKTFTQYGKDGKKHYYVQIDSKVEGMPEGTTLDITYRTIIDALKEYYESIKK